MIDAPTNIWAKSIHAPLSVPGGVQSLSTIVATPLSYQFRVIEWTKNGIATGGVELQVKLTTHDQYGKILNEGPWNKVPRIKMES
jgi:hypothetical protein